MHEDITKLVKMLKTKKIMQGKQYLQNKVHFRKLSQEEHKKLMNKAVGITNKTQDEEAKKEKSGFFDQSPLFQLEKHQLNAKMQGRKGSNYGPNTSGVGGSKRTNAFYMTKRAEAREKSA